MWLFKKREYKTDEDILKAYRRDGDQELFSDLFKKHVVSVYGTCVFYLRDKDEAQDAVMQIFEKLMADLRVRDIENFKAWLAFVVRNYCISLIRKKKTQFKHLSSYYDFELEETTYDTELKIEQVDDEAMIAYMKEGLQMLKPKQKICVELFYLKNQSYQQISEQTGYPVNEVKSYIQNGKRNLKLMIEEKIKQPAK